MNLVTFVEFISGIIFAEALLKIKRETKNMTNFI